MDQQTIIAIVLVTLAVGGVLFAVLPYLTGEIKAEKRQEALKAPAAKKTAGVDRAKDGEARRKQVADSLKEIESRKTRKITLETKFQQAGLNWTRPKFYLISVAMCAGFTFFVYVVTKNVYLIGPAALIGLFGLPAWILSFLKKRRIVKFIDVFPNAIDVIVRGIKAGLPLGHCLQIIASESPEPVRSEFRQILEAQTIGLTVAEAIERTKGRASSSRFQRGGTTPGESHEMSIVALETYRNLLRILIRPGEAQETSSYPSQLSTCCWPS